ncbi:copper chaperone PCu(A)C [Sphingomonas sp. CFBP 13728]|uniref:copper chaperone PCu(A)C n=1 Tax=unclassified Sphingomonas TaxID=196159 RepID=UPI00177B410E|nr:MULTISPECIES: copper chaperone PCu(A)C [unclassified Sphingomonas]MBD8620828.1 copper chaperone PCu(A)C [Sphingomonas sp. CFBP 13728]MBD8737194.1 copper chaperone PCu(A)C [Sphingomonas sp. CFBP 13706]
MTYRIALALVATLAAPALAQDVRKGSLTISQPWSRATSPRATVGAGFLTIRNAGARGDRLISATSPRAERVEIHTMSMDGGVMRMRQLVDGLAVPAGGTATLAPSGNHIMLIGLKSPLKAGERVPATLRFARAGTVTVQFVIGGAGDSAPAAQRGGHK